MYLLDTSYWIALLNGKEKPLSDDLLSRVAICSPVLQEILQGIKEENSFRQIRESLLSLPNPLPSIESDTFLMAADLYRSGRKKGYTIRSNVDCLIAAIALQTHLPIIHKDRDFAMIARYTDLQVFDSVKGL